MAENPAANQRSRRFSAIRDVDYENKTQSLREVGIMGIEKRLFYNLQSGLLKSAGILIFLAVCLLIHTGLNAQGSLQFNTRIRGTVDARVTYLDGTPISGGFSARLCWRTGRTCCRPLTPLPPLGIFTREPIGCYRYS